LAFFSHAVAAGKTPCRLVSNPVSCVHEIIEAKLLRAQFFWLQHSFQVFHGGFVAAIAAEPIECAAAQKQLFSGIFIFHRPLNR